MNGTILWYNNIRNFGFIFGDDETKYFVHKKYIKDEGWTPQQGDYVVFECGTNDKGAYAFDVKQQDK